jgi:23S rRNA pseudouridine1911/1915/1917 synthase
MSAMSSPEKERRGVLNVVYEDNHVLGVVKPGGVLAQGDRTGDATLLDHAKSYLKHKYNKPGNVFVGLVHRIDRPASGVMVLARTSKAASRLAGEFSSRHVSKTYFAVVHGVVDDEGGELTGFVQRDHLRSRLVGRPGPRARESRLRYRVLDRRESMSLLEVEPETGRHHQIRLQLSAAGYPIVGDLKYGAARPLPDKTIALHSGFLVFRHPTRDEDITLSAPPPDSAPWSFFRKAIGDRFP